MVNLVVVIDERGFQITRIPSDPDFVKPVTVEMEAQDPKLGIITCGDSMNNFVRALNEALAEATSQSEQALVINPDLHGELTALVKAAIEAVPFLAMAQAPVVQDNLRNAIEKFTGHAIQFEGKA